jgi:hypothetical protein
MDIVIVFTSFSGRFQCFTPHVDNCMSVLLDVSAVNAESNTAQPLHLKQDASKLSEGMSQRHCQDCNKNVTFVANSALGASAALGEGPANAIVANVLDRPLQASAPNRKWIVGYHVCLDGRGLALCGRCRRSAPIDWSMGAIRARTASRGSTATRAAAST